MGGHLGIGARSAMGACIVAAACLIGASACGGASARLGGAASDSGYVRADDGVRLFYRTIGGGSLDVVIPVGFYLEDALRPLASRARRLVF